jgi:hypothetical protein
MGRVFAPARLLRVRCGGRRAAHPQPVGPLPGPGASGSECEDRGRPSPVRRRRAGGGGQARYVPCTLFLASAGRIGTQLTSPRATPLLTTVLGVVCLQRRRRARRSTLVARSRWRMWRVGWSSLRPASGLTEAAQSVAVALRVGHPSTPRDSRRAERATRRRVLCLRRMM